MAEAFHQEQRIAQSNSHWMQQSMEKYKPPRYYAHDAYIFPMQRIETSNPLGVEEYSKI